jgi:hypothetical protein
MLGQKRGVGVFEGVSEMSWGRADVPGAVDLEISSPLATLKRA